VRAHVCLPTVRSPSPLVAAALAAAERAARDAQGACGAGEGGGDGAPGGVGGGGLKGKGAAGSLKRGAGSDAREKTEGIDAREVTGACGETADGNGLTTDATRKPRPAVNLDLTKRREGTDGDKGRDRDTGTDSDRDKGVEARDAGDVAGEAADAKRKEGKGAKGAETAAAGGLELGETERDIDAAVRAYLEDLQVSFSLRVGLFFSACRSLFLCV